ncbi:hypothetical protein POM88_002145 [Heracleum sosnowskyi]|uniref:Post-SET domain-containing protein n=1 Tax=Heracleum sosnowskyi TaxID=360622 RepID=A0AAD8N5P4_9APIA|nr:hypothetical protein POM88_002145 [Heracleum sosnowskyi]
MGSWNLLIGHFGIATFTVMGLLNPLHHAGFVQLQVFTFVRRAIKPTTDWCWAHLACAICIPETFLLDVRKMEVMDALNVITKDRLNLLCSICEEELTYNNRFLSVDEQLACYCGVPSCRGVVNDINAVEQVAMLCVPRSELTAEKENK